ncbi:sporulation protein Cse60 [Streptococcus alactolyticus]
MAKSRLETNKELAARVNEFIADKKVIDIKYQEATYGTYEDMSVQLSIMVIYEEVN